MSNVKFDITQMPQSIQDLLNYPPANLEQFIGGGHDIGANFNNYNTTFDGYVTDPRGLGQAGKWLETVTNDPHIISHNITKNASARTYRKTWTIKPVGSMRWVSIEMFGTAWAWGCWAVIDLSDGSVFETSGYGSGTTVATMVVTANGSWWDVSMTFTSDTTALLQNSVALLNSSTRGGGHTGVVTDGLLIFNPKIVDIT